MPTNSHFGAASTMDEATLLEFSGQILGELQSGQLVLPMLPEVTLRVSDMASDPNASLDDMAQLIITDVTLSAQLIKVSNSPLYRGREPVESVPTAVSRLGFRIVKNLVSSLAMQQMFQTTSSQVEHRLRNMWELNVDVAARSHVLAAKVPGLQVDEAMLAGLIHNIGVLPLLVKAEEEPLLLEENTLLDNLIADLSGPIGVAILESWDFPNNLVAVVQEYRDFNRAAANDPDLTDVVQVASLQSHLNTQVEIAMDQIGALPAFRKLGIQTDVEVEELDETSEEYASALAFFS